MRLPGTDREAIDRLKNHFISKMIPGVGTWGELDVLRGWKDDFLGKAFHEQYTVDPIGAGSSIALVDSAHGGWARLTSGPDAGDQAFLWLDMKTLDTDEGFIQICRGRISHSTSVFFNPGAAWVAATNDYCEVLCNTDWTNNWMIASDNGTGAVTWVDSGVPIDTGWHWHCLIASVGRLEHWLDGSLINVKTDKVPTVVMTPFIRCRRRAAVVRWADVDYWGVIPKNL